MKPSNVVTEVFDGTTWSTLEPYPYWVAINSYGVVSLPDQVVLFGGRISNGNLGSDIIASFKSGNQVRTLDIILKNSEFLNFRGSRERTIHGRS